MVIPDSRTDDKRLRRSCFFFFHLKENLHNDISSKHLIIKSFAKTQSIEKYLRVYPLILS